MIIHTRKNVQKFMGELSLNIQSVRVRVEIFIKQLKRRVCTIYASAFGIEDAYNKRAAFANGRSLDNTTVTTTTTQQQCYRELLPTGYRLYRPLNKYA